MNLLKSPAYFIYYSAMGRIMAFMFLFFLISKETLGQSIFINNKYSLESSLFLSTTDRLPFWLRSNQYGEVPLESQFMQFGAEVQHEYDSLFNRDKKLKKFSYGYGARAIANVGKVNQFRLTEGYIKARFGVFEIYGGRRREIVGLVDTLMTSGSYIWSGNAQPLPKIQVSIPNYTPILGKGLISIKGTFAHGWFGSTDSVKNYFLHQKTFYARLGKPSWKMKFYGGFNHQVQWGGRPSFPWYDIRTNQLITQYPSDLNTYINVVTGLSLNRNLVVGDQDGIPYNEAFNRAGNHLGTIDLAFDFKTPFGTFLIYRQSIYEDGSLYYLNNVNDGLSGISLTSKNMHLLIEYLDTRNQGGSTNSHGVGKIIPQLRGRDDYFNNSIYLDGYTYNSNAIGTPYLMPYYIFNTGNTSKSIYANNIYHNRMKTLSLAINYQFTKLKVLMRYSYMQSEGRYGSNLKLYNNSTLIDCSYAYRSLVLNIKTSTDFGTFWDNKILGTKLGVIKSF